MLTFHEEKPRWTFQNDEKTTRRKQQQHKQQHKHVTILFI